MENGTYIILIGCIFFVTTPCAAYKITCNLIKMIHYSTACTFNFKYSTCLYSYDIMYPALLPGTNLLQWLHARGICSTDVHQQVVMATVSELRSATWMSRFCCRPCRNSARSSRTIWKQEEARKISWGLVQLFSRRVLNPCMLFVSCKLTTMLNNDIIS